MYGCADKLLNLCFYDTQAGSYNVTLLQWFHVVPVTGWNLPWKRLNTSYHVILAPSRLPWHACVEHAMS